MCINVYNCVYYCDIHTCFGAHIARRTDSRCDAPETGTNVASGAAGALVYTHLCGEGARGARQGVPVAVSGTVRTYVCVYVCMCVSYVSYVSYIGVINVVR
jgi:hypothetical protein